MASVWGMDTLLPSPPITEIIRETKKVLSTESKNGKPGEIDRGSHFAILTLVT